MAVTAAAAVVATAAASTAPATDATAIEVGAVATAAESTADTAAPMAATFAHTLLFLLLLLLLLMPLLLPMLMPLLPGLLLMLMMMQLRMLLPLLLQQQQQQQQTAGRASRGQQADQVSGCRQPATAAGSRQSEQEAAASKAFSTPLDMVGTDSTLAPAAAAAANSNHTGMMIVSLQGPACSQYDLPISENQHGRNRDYSIVCTSFSCCISSRAQQQLQQQLQLPQ